MNPVTNPTAIYSLPSGNNKIKRSTFAAELCSSRSGVPIEKATVTQQVTNFPASM
jgi:hypothetical protein